MHRASRGLLLWPRPRGWAKGSDSRERIDSGGWMDGDGGEGLPGVPDGFVPFFFCEAEELGGFELWGCEERFVSVEALRLRGG